MNALALDACRDALWRAVSSQRPGFVYDAGHCLIPHRYRPYEVGESVCALRQGATLRRMALGEPMQRTGCLVGTTFAFLAIPAHLWWESLEPVAILASGPLSAWLATADVVTYLATAQCGEDDGDSWFRAWEAAERTVPAAARGYLG